MKQFDINRFWLTMKWFFYEYRGQMLKWTLGVMLATTLVQMGLISVINPGDIEMEGGNTPYKMAVITVNVLCTVFVVISVIIVGCNIFSLLKNKQKRIAFLTLPATNLERWIVAFIFAVILIPICIVVAYMLGDILRNVVFYIQGKEWVWGQTVFFDKVSQQGKQGMMGMILSWAVALWSISLYVLGGTFFRKGQFIIVTLFQIAFSTLLSWLAVTFKTEILTFLANGIKAGQENAIGYVAIGVVVACALFHFWLSYKLFTRFQVITSNWTNL